jgi:hypothetical protein
MTPDQLRGLMKELQEVVERHRERAEDARADGGAEGDRTSPVWLLMYAFPAGDSA